MNRLFFLLLTSIIFFSSCVPYKNLNKLESMKDLNYPFDVNYAALSNDINLAYVDEGSGTQTIIFIHGLGSYIPAWQKNINELKTKYRCIAVDLPGYGKSSKDPHSGKMSFYADVLIEFIEKLKLENIVLAGHSMGGQISMHAALRYPEKINKLILAAPAGFERFHEGQKEWFRDVMTVSLVKNTSVDAIQSNLAYNFYNMPDDAEFMITDRINMRSANDFENYCHTVVKSVDGMVDEPVIDKLDLINQEVLIIFGEKDNLIPNRYLNPGFTKDIAENGHSKLPNSTLVLIPKAGHFVQFEKADEFNAAVKDFLK